MFIFDRNWYWYCRYHTDPEFKERKLIYNQKHYKKHREKILEQKKEYYKRKKNE